MNLPTEVIMLLYTKNLTKLKIEAEKNNKLLDVVYKLTADNNHYKRQNKIMSNMILDKDKEIKSLNLELYHQEDSLNKTKDSLQSMTLELQSTSIKLQRALDAYAVHA